MRIHCLENVDKALQFLKEQRVHLENMGSHDIVDGNHRLTLGLIWTIILRFQVRSFAQEAAGFPHTSFLWTGPPRETGLLPPRRIVSCHVLHFTAPDNLDFPIMTGLSDMGFLGRTPAHYFLVPLNIGPLPFVFHLQRSSCVTGAGHFQAARTSLNCDRVG